MKSTLTAHPCFVWVMFFLPLLISSCGGSNSDKTDAIVNPPDIGAASDVLEQGVLLDSVVIGARYDAGDGVTGNTDANGVFNYRPGNAVSFYIGELKLGTAMPIDRPAYLIGLKAEKVVTPVELAGENTRLDEPATLNIARLLIAVDDDADSSNGIALSSSVISNSSGAGVVNYDDDASVVAAIRYLNNDGDEIGPIPDYSEVKQHLCISIRSADCDTTITPPISATTGGSSSQGTTTQGSTIQGTATEGSTTESTTTQGNTTQGNTTQGTTTQGNTTQGPTTQDNTTGGSTTNQESPPNQPPYITGAPQTEIIAGDSYLFTPVATDSDSDSLSFTIDGMPSWARFDASNGTLSGSPQESDEGANSQVVISVSDGKAVSKLEAFSLRVTASNTAPVLSGEPTTEIKSGETYRFTPHVSNKEGDALEYSVVALPAWGQFNATNGEITGNPDKTDVGVYENIQITVSDGKLSSSIGPFAITVSLSNSAPDISGTPAITVAGNSEYLFSPATTDADSDPLVFTIDQAPAWTVFDTATGTLSGTPGNDQAGNYANIVIGVSDGRETAQLAPFSIEVTYTNTAPVISGAPTTWIQPGSSYSFTPTTVDNDPNTSLAYSAQNLPAWATLDPVTGTITGTPSVEDLHQNIVLTASDGKATDDLGAAVQ